ncbi:MAG: ribosome-associated translation inhibitor RaiA [Clostridia bacterium]|nr:ribosome-associated translation inhibitor RaiA [Clostridia bacterium]
MKYNLICKHVELSDKSKEKLLKKFDRLEKFFGDDEEIKIVASEQRSKMIVEITINHKGILMRAEARNEDMLTAADICMENLDRQIRKNKTRLESRVKGGGFKDYIPFTDTVVEEEQDIKIIKSKKVESKPMSAEEAVLQMNMLGHDFFIFNDAETDAVCVVYKRKGGNYGLIEIG